MFGGASSTPFGSPSGGLGGFGQPSTSTTPLFGGGGGSSTFGTPAASGSSSLFGQSPAGGGGFGGGGLGAPSTGGFGTSSGFGSSTVGTTGGFGTSTSTFGSTTNSSPFGAPAAPSPSAFGSTTTTTGFGAFGTPAPAPSAFGTSSAFGAPAPSPATSVFGGGGFGSTTTSTFGAPASSSAFGSTTGGFGTPSPAPATTGLFGAPAPAPTGGGIFGSSSTTSGTSAFGSSTTGGGMFGGSSTLGSTTLGQQPTGQPPAWAAGQPQMGSGTRQHAYAPTVRNDGQGTITLQTITAMAPYENFSLEELRVQDYAMGNRGNASQPGAVSAGGGLFGAPTAPGGFGAPAPTGGGLFGAPSPAPSAFGASPATNTGFGSTFGSPAPAPFGAPAPSAFGAPAPAQGLFGSAPTSTFGSTSTTPATSAFGAPAPGLFGAAPTSTFGSTSTTPAPGGLFGAPQPAPSPGGGLFGGGGGGFGASPAPAFGGFGSTPIAAPAPSTGLFGAPQPAPAPAGGFGGFGAAPAPPPAFGAAPAGGLFGGGSSTFGQPAPAPTSAFGAAPTGGLFGGLTTSAFGQPAPAPTSAFGAPSPAAGGGFAGSGAFGAQPAAQPPPMVHPTGNIMPPATNELVAAQLAAMEAKRKEMEERDNFLNQPLASSAVIAASQNESTALRSLAAFRPSYPVYHAVSPSSAKIRPRGFASPPDNGIISQSLANLGAGGRPMATPEAVAATSSTRLSIRPKPKPKLKLSLPPSNGVDQIEDQQTNARSAKNGENGLLANTSSPGQKLTPSVGSDRPDPVSTPQIWSQKRSHTPSTTSSEVNESATKSAIRNVAFEHYLKASGAGPDTENSAMNGSRPSHDLKVSGMAPKLSKPDYECSPSISELQEMPPEDLATVLNFSVERVGVGKIEWAGAVDVRNANLDTLVVIEPKSIQVYTEEEKNNSKPPVGTKLNRPAVLTMYGIFPREGADPVKFAEKVKSQTEAMGASFIEYDADSGVWSLLVQHF